MQARLLAATMVSVLVLAAGCDFSKTESQRRVAEGVEYVHDGNYAQAVRSFEEAIAVREDNAQAHYYLGLTRLQYARDPNGSLVNLERAAELEPENADALYQLGVALSELDRDAQARERFERATAVDPNHGRALYRLGLLVEADGEIRDAIDLYHRAIHAEPRLAQAYNALGSIYAEFGHPTEAVQVFENGLENRPGDAGLLAALGRVQLTEGNYDMAIRRLNEALDRGADPSSAAYNLAEAHRARFEQTEADSDRRAALAALRRAGAACNPSVSQMRCSSINSAMIELERSAQE